MIANFIYESYHSGTPKAHKHRLFQTNEQFRIFEKFVNFERSEHVKVFFSRENVFVVQRWVRLFANNVQPLTNSNLDK